MVHAPPNNPVHSENTRGYRQPFAGRDYFGGTVVPYLCRRGISLPQQRDNPFNVERTSLAAAVSNIVYRARLGRLYSRPLEDFFATIERPLQQVLDEWPPDRQHGTLMGVSTDGNGVGYILAATVAMRFFGLHAVSLPLFTAALMGLSAFLLLWQFHGDVAGLVVLNFCSLTVLLFTMRVWDPAYAMQIAVGGIRYFSLASGRRLIIVAGTLLFTASTIPLYLIAWADKQTIADLAFFSVFGAGLALGALCLGVQEVLRQQMLVMEAIRAIGQKKGRETK
jgi:hypothetical protein